MKNKLLVASLKLLAKLPYWSLQPISRFLAPLVPLLAKSTSQVIAINLKTCFPEYSHQQINSIAKARHQQLILASLEMAKIWGGRQAETREKILSVKGDELIHQTLANGQGVVFVSPHIGNWELLGQYMGEQFPTTCMYQPPENEAMHELIVNGRLDMGISLAPTNVKGIKVLLKALKSGEAVGILPDQVPSRPSGEYAPFFNEPAYTMTLVHSLISRTGAKAFLAIALRDSNKQGFHLEFEPVDPLIYSEQQAQSLIGLNKTVETCVRKAPEQYQWEYKRFKYRPDGNKHFYKPSKQ